MLIFGLILYFMLVDTEKKYTNFDSFIEYSFICVSALWWVMKYTSLGTLKNIGWEEM